jgi:hypothetical protein
VAVSSPSGDLHQHHIDPACEFESSGRTPGIRKSEPRMQTARRVIRAVADHGDHLPEFRASQSAISRRISAVPKPRRRCSG